MKNSKKGSIKWILIIIVAFFLASYYLDFNVKEVVEDEQTQDNIEYVTKNTKSAYNNYAKDAVSYVWNDIFIELIWKSFISNMERLKEGRELDFELAAPGVELRDGDINQLRTN